MKGQANKLFVGMVVLLTFFSFSSVLADVLVITPEKAEVRLRGHIKFEAQLFNQFAVPNRVEQQIEWRVIPEELGKISDDGFFMAGDKPGRGLVVAAIKMSGQVFKAEAKIQVGTVAQIAGKLPELVIKPAEAALDFGEKMKFKAEIKFPATNQLVPNMMLNWTVKPYTLGRISQKGEFVAGNQLGRGKVVAYTEFQGVRIFGEAYVVVGTKASGAIAGVVNDEDNGSALAEAVILAHRIGEVRWYRRTLSDQNGNYLLEKLIPGKYVIKAMKQGFVSEFYQDVRYFAEATPVEVAKEDTVKGIDFNLNLGGAIAGNVSDENQAVLGDAHIVATLAVNHKEKYHTMTDENGDYTLTGLHSGTYIVGSDKEGFQGEFFNNKLRFQDADEVQVTEPETTENIDFILGTISAIAGVVTSDEAGFPAIEGAIVIAKNLNHPNWLGAKRVQTNKNGAYILQVPAGNYLVRVEADSFNGEFYDDVYDPALATPVEVLENQHTNGIDFGLAPLSSLTGIVTNEATQLGIPNAIVYAYPEVGNGKPVKARTDENGNYELTKLYPGIYFVRAWADGYHPEFYDNARNLADADPVPVGYNEIVPDINFSLTAASSINGVVLAEDTNLPIGRALVVAKMFGSFVKKQAFTNENGEYKINGLPAGKYFVTAMAEGYYREFYDNAQTFDEADTVEVGESENVAAVDFALAPASDNQGVISGLIFDDADQLPIPGAMVVAVPVKNGKPHFGVTNSEGRYALKGLPTDKYYVLTWAAGYIGEFYDDVHHWQRATLVSVVSPNRTPDIDFGLAKKPVGPYVIRGKILARHNQKPLANVLVYAFRHQDIVGFGVTDEQGNYEIPEMPNGQFKIVASIPGMVQDNDSNTSTDDSLAVNLASGVNDVQANITMELETSTSVSELDASIPASFSLDQNYPNPFNPETEIHFTLPETGVVTLRIFNVLGQKITTLVNEQRPVGEFSISWNGTNQFGQKVTSGIYFYRIRVKNSHGVVFDQIKKMTLMK